jgi:hypothetical protein
MANKAAHRTIHKHSRYSIYGLVAFVLMASVWISCETGGITGDYIENQPPSTFMTIADIDREEGFRLSSQITISWWGNDPDGYIVGYEYAINDTSEGAWTFTTKTDSTFILPITEGQTIDDVLFKVRAIDNNGAKDPKGARLSYPIINSTPTVAFKTNETPADTMFGIASFGWTINDPDGLLNVRSTQIAINDTVNGWVDVPFNQSSEGQIFISLAVDNSNLGAATAQLYLGRSFSSAVTSDGDFIFVDGIQVGTTNTAYVRTIDAAGAVSDMDATQWFVKQQTSKVLLLNDIGKSSSISDMNWHLSYLNELGIDPDIWLINTGQPALGTIELSDQFPKVVDPTLKKTLASWDHIYWISDDVDRNIVHALDITSEFFAGGGTMFAAIPMKEVSQEDVIFNFLPVDSIGYFPSGGIETGFVLNAGTEITSPTDELAPTLKLGTRVVGWLPIKPISGSTLLYESDYRATTLLGFITDYTLMEGVSVQSPEENLIYFGMDLTKLNGNNNMREFLDYMCIQKLGFEN